MAVRARPRPGTPVKPTTSRPAPPWLLPLSAVVLHLLLCLISLDPGPFQGGDNGSYVALARGLLEQGRYVDYWDPAMPPHTQYPPVFPVILAAGLAMGLSVWVGVKLLCIALSAAAVGVSALWLRRVLPPVQATVAALVVAVAPGALMIAANVLSDVPFWTFTMLTLWAYARAEGEVGRRRWEVLGAAAAIAALFTRSAGLPLIVAIVVWLVMRRRWRALAILAAPLAPLMIAWAMHTGSAGGYASHLLWKDPYVHARGTIGPLDLLARIADNVRLYAVMHLPTLLYGRSGNETAALVPLSVALLLLAVAGWARRVRRPGIPELFVPLYLGLLLIWPAGWSGDRLLLPLLPLLLAYAARTAALGARWGRWLPLAGAAVLLLPVLPGITLMMRLGILCRDQYGAHNPAPCRPPEWSELLASGNRIRGRLPEGSVVLHRKPTLFFVTSGYRSRVYPASDDPQQLLRAAREAGARYVLIDQTADLSPFLHRAVNARKHLFCVLEEVSSPNAVLVRIEPDAPPLPADWGADLLRTCPPGAATAPPPATGSTP